MGGNCQWRCPLPGDWVRGKLVGCGSFGSVHMAMAKSTGGLFVVKSAQSDEVGLQALLNEVNILETLNSPHIVKCIGKEISREHECHVFMEYMAGGNLLDVVDTFGGSLEEEVVGLYTKKILLGLKYLHENGIVHCDLKCKNVLLSSSGDVKLADFGSAKRIKDSRSQVGFADSWQNIGGTPLWMAPEVMRNEGLDFVSDIWSLGCTVIEMATGKPPNWDVEVSNPMAAIMKIACGNERPRFPRKFSEMGLDFLAKCLERDHRKRWRAEELLKHPFVSGENDIMRNLREEEQASFSPASVLDIGIYDEVGSDSEEADSRRTNPFTRWFHERKWIGTPGQQHQQQQLESQFESSEIWITVR
ncbi:hypothetical protein FNV43_RR18949 [Rhamnella rubrinervis]|uniref:Protein kinase domain-containing protein n=1 Tax=Rhamnella rubrinervis TaxID=2594499 RepID=A0A8K0GY58_9ROSA|nr:hypothetical protein FNV43_RR18949 [Rhamnella rubrinervis]